MVGLKGKLYEAWTADNVLASDCLNEIEWQAFYKLYAYVTNSDFYHSRAGIAHVEEMDEIEKNTQNVLELMYIDHRKRNILHWVKEFLRMEVRIDTKADFLMEFMLDMECARLVDDKANEEGDRETFMRMYKEQEEYEFLDLYSDDVVYWSLNDLFEQEMYESSVEAVFQDLWNDPETKEALVHKYGIEKKVYKARLLIKMDVRNESHDFFNDFMKDTNDAPVRPVGSASDYFASIIQKRVRGVLSRNKARKLFVQSYSKT
jgi:hypothetical protein